MHWYICAAFRANLYKLPATLTPSARVLYLFAMRYEVNRSTRHKLYHVICRDEAFYRDVPDEIRHNGPWWTVGRGDIDALKPEYRLAIARQGYAVEICSMLRFSAVPVPVARDRWAPWQPADFECRFTQHGACLGDELCRCWCLKDEIPG